MARYRELVAEWSPRLDLVSPGDLARLEERHIQDSLRALTLVRACPPGPAVDVGSGAGFPGVVLAIAEPTRAWRLLEPRSKRAGFLDEVVRALDLGNVEVVRAAAQEAARDPRLAGAHSVGTARALAAPARAFELLAPLLGSGGLRIVWLGENSKPPPGAALREGSLATMPID
ncbi:MAG: 16S rRNA (guanine(527)-N(7))-methyltransferase RsmG [Actinomycetota bacterium]